MSGYHIEWSSSIASYSLSPKAWGLPDSPSPPYPLTPLSPHVIFPDYHVQLCRLYTAKLWDVIHMEDLVDLFTVTVFWKMEVNFLKEETLFPSSCKGIFFEGEEAVTGVLLYLPSIPAVGPRHHSLVRSALFQCLQPMAESKEADSVNFSSPQNNVMKP